MTATASPAPPETGRGIRVSSVRRAFGAVQAVDSMTFEARPGEVTALIGPNGSGKTTLLRMLAGLLAPDEGSITIDGLDPVTDARAVRQVIGWMPDGFGTWDALTVREVLETLADAHRIPRELAAPRIDELLVLLHLDDLADRRARVLSRGQKQRLGLAGALIHEPTTLLLDEPASGLDPRSRIELRDVLRSLADQGRTVLVSSHILTELQEVADRAVIVAQGRTVDVQAVAAQAGGPGGATGTGSLAWRVVAGDGVRLTQWLGERGLSHRRLAGGAVEVDVVGEDAAADLLGELVRDGIRVTSYAPSQGALEAAYLAVTQDRQ